MPAVTSEERWLVSVLRGTPYWPPSATHAFAPDRLLETAAIHGVVPLIFDKTRRTRLWDDLPETLRSDLYRRVKRATAWETASRGIVAEDLGRLASHGIDFLLLKGAGLAHTLYPSPHLRTRGDLDLLVSDSDAANRAWDLLRELGYRRPVQVSGAFVSHQFSCSKTLKIGSTLTCDIHWKLSNSNFFAQKFQFADLWAERLPVAALGDRAYTLSWVHALVLALFHRTWHLGEGETDRLIWRYDIDLLCRRFEPDDWDRFADIVSSGQLQPICRDGLLHVADLFGTPVPAWVLTALNDSPTRASQLALQQPGLRRTLVDILSLPSWGERIGMLGEYLFPGPDYMRARFGIDRGWKLPFAYLARAFRGLRKRLGR